MKSKILSSTGSHLVLFSNTHVIFLEKNEQGLADALSKRDINFKDSRIDQITRLPSGVQIGKAYRHYSPNDLDYMK